MTNIYFIRHAEPDYNNHNDRLRELSQKGLKDREQVTKYLEDKHIDIILSSPYKRAIDTVQSFADQKSMEIEIIEDFRERKVDSGWIEDFSEFCRKQWEDFNYKRSDGETLAEVQKRNIRALNNVLEKYENKNIVIGTHGTALSTILNYFDNSFGYEEFNKIKGLMPWIVKMVFEGTELVSYETIDVLALPYGARLAEP